MQPQFYCSMLQGRSTVPVRKESPLSAKSTREQEPWQSWGDTARFVLTSLALATPTALLVWQACVRH